MEIKILTCDDELWTKTASYAESCSWRAGANLANLMKMNKFSDWERVFVAMTDNNIAGYCALLKKDCLPIAEYTPYISFIFVGEPYRGHKISEKLCLAAIHYAQLLGFDKVYLVSDHTNLYEKYGFIEIDKKVASWGAMQTVFMRSTMNILH